MLDLNLEKKTVYKVGIYGKEYDLRKPTVKEAEQMRKAVKAAGDEPQLEIFSKFLAHLGLPQDVVESMEMDHFVKLTEFLLAGKKN